MGAFIEVKYSCMNETSTTLLQRVEIFARGSENIPAPKSTWVTGSIAYDVSTGIFYMLDDEAGVWVSQDDFTVLGAETISTNTVSPVVSPSVLDRNKELMSDVVPDVAETSDIQEDVTETLEEIGVEHETVGHSESE